MQITVLLFERLFIRILIHPGNIKIVSIAVYKLIISYYVEKKWPKMCAKIYPPLSSTLCKISSAVELTKALTTTLISGPSFGYYCAEQSQCYQQQGRNQRTQRRGNNDCKILDEKEKKVWRVCHSPKRSRVKVDDIKLFHQKRDKCLSSSIAWRWSTTLWCIFCTHEAANK